MTTSMNLKTNGNYVSEAKNADGTVSYGKAGPGSNVESGWFGVPHEGVQVVEREATAEEIAALTPENDPPTSNGKPAGE